MPGSYAHITSVLEASEKRRLKKIAGFPREAIDAANLHSKFLELGSISPDYPYMHIGSGDSKAWADAMHYTHTCNAIYVGGELVRALPQGIVKEKCLAWYMGFTAHVIADMSVHPVVELKVGQYDGNETSHRRCEMHQDAYIFRRVGTTMPQTAQHLGATILRCGDPMDPEQLDPDIKELWNGVLKIVHPQLILDDPPDMDKWHLRCNTILGKLLPTTSRFIGFARHVCDGLAIDYPVPEEIDKQEYIESLLVPALRGTEKRMHYDDIFDQAVGNIQRVWLNVTRFALGYGDVIAFRDEEWNLDTGRNMLAKEEMPVFWGAA